MKPSRLAQSLVLTLSLAVGTAVLAQVSFSINIGPPPLIFEPVPMMQPGYVWAPGYWAWNNDRHIWIRGRTIVQRPGYRWEPDRWEQRGSTYYRQPGSWARDNGMPPPRTQKPQKQPKYQKPHGNPHYRDKFDDKQGKDRGR